MNPIMCVAPKVLSLRMFNVGLALVLLVNTVMALYMSIWHQVRADPAVCHISYLAAHLLYYLTFPLDRSIPAPSLACVHILRIVIVCPL